MEINSVNALDDLLSGNTTNEPPKEPPAEEEEKEKELVPEETDETTTVESETDNEGDDPNLDSSTAEDDGQKQKALNAAFARMRIENQNYQKTIKQIAEALGIEETDPAKMGETLVDLAHKKLAEKRNIPVELFKDYQTTKEQLAELQRSQNQTLARDKFAFVKRAFELNDDELMTFARQLDADGIDLIANPNIDIEYEYYRRNRQALEDKKIAKAVEEALRKANTAEAQSTTPSKQQGKQTEPETAKVNNVAALESLLSGK